MAELKNERSGGMTILSTKPVDRNVLREEGPTISSTDKVTKSQVSKKIKEFVRELKSENALRWTMIEYNVSYNVILMLQGRCQDPDDHRNPRH